MNNALLNLLTPIIMFIAASVNTYQAIVKDREIYVKLSDVCFIYGALLIVTIMFGCTPKQHAEFHVAAISINGERTVTDFLLGAK